MIISSASNEQIKKIIQLKEKARVRKNCGCFIVEGIKMFEEAPKEEIIKVYVSEQFLSENDISIEEFDYQVVSDSVFRKISDTVTPQGILAVVKQKHYNMETLLSTMHEGRNCFVVLDRLQDPGNLGTIIRTAEGAGINGIIMNSDTVDIFNPKVIRATMGSIYRVPYVIMPDLTVALKCLKEAGVTAYAAHLRGKDCNRIQFADRTAILIGNEAAGLSDEVTGMADELIRIPMKGRVESLNAAVATAILMYQIMK